MSGIEFGVEANADADAGTDGALLDVMGKIHLGLGKLNSALDKQALREQQRLESLPRFLPLQRMSSGTRVTDIVDFGGPQPGRRWAVRMLATFASPLAANAVQTTWYVGQVMPGPGVGMLPATLARWQFPSAPFFQNFTSDVIMINSNEHLIAGLTGIATNADLSLLASINDQPAFGAAAAYAALD